MKSLRWKRRYLTGDKLVDTRNRALLELVTELGAEMKSKEHCQDMNELYARLVDSAQARLETGGIDERDLEQLLKEGFPLAARSTPACKECGLCDLMEERLGKWVEAAENQGKP